MEALQWAGLCGETLGLGGLFLEADDAPVLVGFDDAELLGGFLGGDFDGGHGDIRAGIHVLLQHLRVIHLVDVIAGKNEDVTWNARCRWNRCSDRRRRRCPDTTAGDTHLRRKHFDEFAEAHQGRPAGADVAIEAERFVLGQDENAAKSLN